MNQDRMKKWESRKTERGGSRLKFIIVLLIIGSVAYGAYLYIPVQFDAFRFKDLMQHDVDVAATQGYPTSWITDQITRNLSDYNVPANAIITPSKEDSRVVLRVQFTRPIEFPGYTYQYEFDHTVKSTDFFTIK